MRLLPAGFARRVFALAVLGSLALTAVSYWHGAHSRLVASRTAAQSLAWPAGTRALTRVDDSWLATAQQVRCLYDSCPLPPAYTLHVPAAAADDARQLLLGLLTTAPRQDASITGSRTRVRWQGQLAGGFCLLTVEPSASGWSVLTQALDE